MSSDYETISQLRNFKDFLQLYNRITELCFSSCVDNLFSRDLSGDEPKCIDRCVQKFTNVNHRTLGVYVELQAEITQRRMVEMEAANATILASKSEISSNEITHTIAPETLTDNSSRQ